MTRFSFSALILASALCASIVVGCSEKPAGPAQSKNGKPDASSAKAGGGHDHDHPSQGPHGGALVELGNEEYHAELVHDEKAGAVTVYILDGNAKAPVAIDAKELTINLTHEGKGEQFKLAASPDQGDLQGKSSRFVSSDKELAEELEHEHANAQLAVPVGGKQLRGKIERHHADDGHDGDHKH